MSFQKLFFLGMYLFSIPLFSQKEKYIELSPLYEPDPVVFSFSEIGWKFVAGFMFVMVLFIIVRLAIRYQRNAYRRAAIKVLKELRYIYKEPQNNLCVNQFNVILKNTAMIAYGRKNVASLHDTEWLEFLDSKIKTEMFQPFKEVFKTAFYKKDKISNTDKEKIFEMSKKWINTHVR